VLCAIISPRGAAVLKLYPLDDAAADDAAPRPPHAVERAFASLTSDTGVTCACDRLAAALASDAYGARVWRVEVRRRGTCLGRLKDPASSPLSAGTVRVARRGPSSRRA
jgi:hypothetical protein